MRLLFSLFDHFRLRKWSSGVRNSYNKKHRTSSYKIVSFCWWLVLIPIKVLELFGIAYLLDEVRRSLLKTRLLTPFEQRQLVLVFGEQTLNWNRIRLRENSRLAKIGAKYAHKQHLAFVLFRTVNFSRTIDCEKDLYDMEWLVHEVTHIVQFEWIGSQYIIEALRAQRNGGYSYGGESTLRQIDSIQVLNLEQQAEVMKYYYISIVNNNPHQFYLRLRDDLVCGKI